jgi:hypothetical protein
MFFPTMHLLHIHLWFRVALGFVLLGRLTHHRMPHAVPVRKVSGLPGLPSDPVSRQTPLPLAMRLVLPPALGTFTR